MKNNGLFSTLYIEDVRKDIKLDDNAKSRMATLAQAWKDHDDSSAASLWESFMKQAMGYLEFITRSKSASDNLYELFEDYSFSRCTGILYLIDSGADIDDTDVGRFWPGKLIVELKNRNRNWGILSNGSVWRLYSTKSSRPFEDYVELSLSDTLESGDEPEYGLFEQFFHADSFVPEDEDTDDEKAEQEEAAGVYKCRLDRNRESSESVLEEKVKNPLLNQIDEVLQYICNGFIFDTPRKGDEYTEEERNDIFESAVKLLYRCLFLFYADSRRLLPSEPDKIEIYENHSIHAICVESHKFQWGKRKENEEYDLWQHFKGLINAINEGDPEYGIMGYNGGLFDDEKEEFLGDHKLRNDFMARALYLLSYVEPYDHDSDKEYKIPYEDLEVRHLGELYENILEYKVILADADRIRRRSKKGTDILLASETSQQKGDVLIRKGDVFFGETALERKQTGSYYTPESLVRFLNTKAAIEPLKERFETEFRNRFDEFLKQALEGQDSSARQGGARSAIALIERFVNEVILNFKVCDPAMGSGHFLVDLTNQMAGLVVELLNDIPDIPGVNTQITSRPNTWRRLITRHCIFGVDINPLAVDLAKLSLWLNCFASNHKLTFLDQHLRCGNSLIGIRTFDQLKSIPDRKKGPKKKKDENLDLFPNFDDLSKSLSEAASIYKSIMEMDEDDTDRQRETFEDACALAEEKFAPLADLYTAYLMDSSITENQYLSLFKHFANGKDETEIGSPDLNEVWSKVKTYQSNHHFFHWVLNFPSIFGPNGSGGFDAAVGNPPWDVLKLNSQEFFSNYDPNFRSYKKQVANEISKRLINQNPAISKNWDEYSISFKEQVNYFKEPYSYEAQGQGDVNTFKLFLENFFCILNSHGILGIIVPSGIYTDKGCLPLRELFFKKSHVELLYCFENRWPQVFSAVDGRFKFVLFCTQKGKSTDKFKCTFMEHGPERLPFIDLKSIQISTEQIKKFSPTTLSLFEFISQRQVNIVNNLYTKNSLLGDFSDSNNWHINFHREFHMSDDSDIFNTQQKGLPLYEGKRIWLFDSDLMESEYYIEERIGRKRLLKQNEDRNQLLNYQNYRLCYRKIAASTNERTLISSIIPKNCFTGENLTTGKDNFNGKELLFSCGLLNSFCEDFIIRMRVTTAINIYHIYQIPLPRLNSINKYFQAIMLRSARMICTTSQYSELWSEIILQNLSDPFFWYPDSIPIDNYGPAHEKQIRIRLRDEAKNLTPEWGPHCGVHDRLPDRRDTGDRAQLRAEIDAYVAHLYGLKRDDFSYVLDTFPVLKRKEEAAFGEFMSKRKCLEEYDRIATTL